MKDEHTYGKKMARNGPTTVIYKGTFVSNQSLCSIESNFEVIKTNFSWLEQSLKDRDILVSNIHSYL